MNIPLNATNTESSPRKASPKTIITDFFKSAAIIALATAIGFVFEYFNINDANIVTVYILAVLIISVTMSERWYGLASPVVCVFLYNFLFTKPFYTFKAYGSDYPITFIVMLIAACITSSLAVKIKRNSVRSAETAFRTQILFDTNRLLQQTDSVSGIVSVTANQLLKLSDMDIVFYCAENEKLDEPIIYGNIPYAYMSAYISDKERKAAEWTFRNNKSCGISTAVFPDVKCLYLPASINNKVYGVVGIVIGNSDFDDFEKSIVSSILGECALALENMQNLREKEQAAILAKNEQLRANLLRSISHDLRTPLTSISGNAGILISNGNDISSEQKNRLYTDIYDDSLWLINLVENLLSVTRIEDGTMKLRKNAELIDEVISEAISHLGRKTEEHKIIVGQSEEFLMANIDAHLIIQLVMNIVDNAIKYTPEDSEIRIYSYKEDGFIVTEISDNGYGIPDSVKPKVFDMFYTAETKIADSRRSMGLGLALCKSIVTAHGGTISVHDNKPVGAVFRFTLPAEEVNIHE